MARLRVVSKTFLDITQSDGLVGSVRPILIRPLGLVNTIENILCSITSATHSTFTLANYSERITYKCLIG